MSDGSSCGRTASDQQRGLTPGDHGTLVASSTSERFVVEQHDRRWGTIVLPDDVATCDSGVLRAVLHAAMQHLVPRGTVVATVPTTRLADYLALCVDAGLELLRCDEHAGAVTLVHRRSARFNVHDLVHEARSTIRRYDPAELAERLAGAAPPLVLDTRTETDRHRFGVIGGSVHTPRTVLEWQLDPANGYRLPGLRDFDHPLVVVCNGGYSSSLAAANLARLGFSDVGDLRGGVHAWQRAGLPLQPPDHCHLDAAPANPTPPPHTETPIT